MSHCHGATLVMALFLLSNTITQKAHMELGAGHKQEPFPISG